MTFSENIKIGCVSYVVYEFIYLPLSLFVPLPVLVLTWLAIVFNIYDFKYITNNQKDKWYCTNCEIESNACYKSVS